MEKGQWPIALCKPGQHHILEAHRWLGNPTDVWFGSGRCVEAALKICKRLPACRGRAHASQVEARCMRRLECGFDTRLLAAGALDVGALRRLTRRPHRGRVGPGVQG